jgi:hypothetical protein
MTSKHSEPSNDAIGRINLGEYLVIRMQHDDQIGAALKCQLIAGLLVPAVPTVALVPDSEDLVLARHVDRIIGAAVVDHDDVVDNTHWDYPQRSLQRALGIVSRQHNADFLLADHTPLLLKGFFPLPTGHDVLIPYPKNLIPYPKNSMFGFSCFF